jgi:hypothetical protein
VRRSPWPRTRRAAGQGADRLGVALRRAGQRAAAREPLRAALDLALGRGAAAPGPHGHEELLAAGPARATCGPAARRR